MRQRNIPSRLVRIVGLGLIACTHTDPFVAPLTAGLGPFSSGLDVQLTFNVDQDYWPAWTQDGRGLLYSFVNLENPAHRCLGLLPAAGGSRVWELCDNRAVRDDTLSSYSAYALDNSGRLLLVEALSGTGFASSFPYHIRIQLTDTAAPYVRTTLLTLPVTVGHTPITWISDVAWMNPTTFIALGQQFNSHPNAGPCFAPFPCTDSTFADNGIVLIGTISDGVGILKPFVGTDGATSYAMINDGAVVVFTRRADGRLYKVGVNGGAADSVATVVSDSDHTLLGVTCRGLQCIVAVDPINSVGETAVSTFGPAQLKLVSLVDGSVQTVMMSSSAVATPVVSPISGDLVAQVGGVWGHLATNGSATSDLHLYKDLIP